MSNVVYLIGAGASYGKREINSINKEEIPGRIERGLPIVNQLESALDWYCRELSGTGLNYPAYPLVLDELRWLKEMCKTYPTIDTYAKKLTITGDVDTLTRLKNALSIYFSLIQSHEKRDLRYDGLVASIIQDDGCLPDSISILSWNYDYQLEYVLQDFSPVETDILHIWQNQGITCKGFRSFINSSKFNFVKLNGTAMFSQIQGNKLIDPNEYTKDRFEHWLNDGFVSWKSNISFAWEKDDQFVDNVLPLLKDAKTLVVIGYSFPYVNRSIDKRLIQSMESLQNVYIQDKNAEDVKQSFETLLTYAQQFNLDHHALKIQCRTSVAQFIIPNELS